MRSRLDPNGLYEDPYKYVKRSIEYLRLGYDYCCGSDGVRLDMARKALQDGPRSIAEPTDEQAYEYLQARLFPAFHGYVPVRNDETDSGKQRAFLRSEVSASAAQARSYCVFAQSTDVEYIQTLSGSSRLFTPFVLEFRVASTSMASEEVRNCSASAIANMTMGGRLATIIDEYDAPYDPDQVQTGYIGYAVELEIR